MIYIYRLSRENRELSYKPYFLDNNKSPNYDKINIEELLNKFVSVNNYRSISKNHININFIKNLIGENEKDFYSIYGEDEDIEIAEYGKGCDFLIVSCDSIKNKECSIRSLAGIKMETDMKGRKYTDLSVIVSAKTHGMKRRSNMKSFNGKEILKIIEDVSIKEKCEYIKLCSIVTVVSYYYKNGYRLKRRFDGVENKKQTRCMELLSELYKESIEYGSDYEELIMQNKIIMNFLKRYNSYNEYDYEDQDEADYLMFKKLN